MLCAVSEAHALRCYKDEVGEWIRTDPTFQWALEQWTSVNTYAGVSVDDRSRPTNEVTAGKSIRSSFLSGILIASSLRGMSGLFGSNLNIYVNSFPSFDQLSYPVELVGSFEIGNREAYKSKLQIEHFYTCETGRIWRVLNCVVLDAQSKKFHWLRVQQFERNSREIWGLYHLIEPVGLPVYIPADSLENPLYVVHYCDDDCSLEIGLKGLQGIASSNRLPLVVCFRKAPCLVSK